MKLIVSFSGGKDSLASLIWVKKNLSNKFDIVFCDTGWEHELTYKHIQDVSKQLGMPVTILKNKKYDGMMDMAGKRGRFPSTKARFCTEELKSRPMIDYVLDQVKDDCLIIQGIRGQESKKRAQMQRQCRFFKFYFTPYTSNQMKANELKAKEKLTKAQQKKLDLLQAKLEKGITEEKYHTYRKKEVIKFCQNHADDILRPIFEWTGQQTIDYIIQSGYKPNPLYSMGMKRVGCFPCVMCGHSEIKSIIERFPGQMDYIQSMEEKLGTTFFKPDYIPKRFCSGTGVNKKGKQVRFPYAKDIVKYLKDKHDIPDDFNPDLSCMSYYGICE